MGKRKQFLFRTILSILLVGVCLLTACPFLSLAEQKSQTENAGPVRKVVRVGFPLQKNMAEITEDGTYTGYMADYLSELVHYTGWEIEYVQAEGDINTQLNTLSDMLDAGEIDMLGTMNISDYLQELYLYPSYSYGNTYTALTVAQDSTLWQSDDYQSWDGMRVAACPALERRMQQLKHYAGICGFTYETVEYETMEEVTGAVRNGEADACLQVDINIVDGTRIIARFNPTPYYFALNKERTDLLKELNLGMYNLMEAYPSLQSELYNRYFLVKDELRISDEDRVWLESLEPLRVLYFTGNAPIQDERDGEPFGVAATFLNGVCEATGMRMTPVFADTYEEGMELIESGSVDVVAAVSTASELYADLPAQFSYPYFESSAVWVVNGDGKTDHDADMDLSVNAEKELWSLRKREGTEVLLDASITSYYMRKKVIYDNLHVDWTNQEAILYSVGFLPTVDERMIGIFNGAVNSLSEQTKQNMLYLNSRKPVRYTLEEQFIVDKWKIAMLLTAALILVLVTSRMHRGRMLQEQVNEIKYLQLFSKMTNECIIKYSNKQDQLMMQNSQIVFQDREIIQPFLAEDAEVEVRDDNERRFVERMQEMLRSKLTSSELKLTKNDAPRWFRIELVYADDDFTIGRFTDINREVNQRAMLEHEATHDALTGIMNRAAIHQKIDRHLGESQEGIFLLLDLDNFKKVNDMLGHQEGDKVLKRFAGFLNLYFRSQDDRGRLGGDEFVVFLPVHICEQALQNKLDQFMKDIAVQVFQDYQECGLSVSIGAAYAGESMHTFDDLYRDADSAMYVAKHGGKNSYYISDGNTCARRNCVDCRKECKKRDYLIAHGVLDSTGADRRE